MAGTILENLSGKKLSILVGTLLICQVICFLIGGLIGNFSIIFLTPEENDSLRVWNNFCLFFSAAPVPANVQTILGTVCKDIPGSFNDTTKWVYSRGNGKCDRILESDLERHDVRLANQIVFVFQVCRRKRFLSQNSKCFELIPFNIVIPNC